MSSERKRGFASLSMERRREIAAMGGKAVKAENRQFSKNREMAAASGRKGGQAVSPETRSFSKDRELASAAGRKGGYARGHAKRTTTTE